MMTINVTPIRLTSFFHGGGCKIAAGVRPEIVKNSTRSPVYPALMAGVETPDAAVCKLRDEQELVRTSFTF
jgi:selenide,water dikinase